MSVKIKMWHCLPHLKELFRIAIFISISMPWTCGALASSQAKIAGEARVLFASGKYEEALSMYRKALSSETSEKLRALLHFNSGCCLLSLGKAEDARDEFVLALVTPEQAPKPVIIYNLAHALYELGDREQALKSLRQCLILEPSFRDAKLYYEWILKQKPPENEPPDEPPPSDQPQAPPPPNLLEKLPSPPQKPAQDQLRPPEPPPASGMKPW